MQALEIATGTFDTIYVVTPDGSGGQQISTGGVFSFYEFWQPRSDRLSDEEWWDMLDDGTLPARPVWAEEYLGL